MVRGLQTSLPVSLTAGTRQVANHKSNCLSADCRNDQVRRENSMGKTRFPACFLYDYQSSSGCQANG